MSSHSAAHGSAKTKAARRAWLRLVIKAFLSLGIEAVKPIAQCLAIHPAGLGCLGSLGAFNYHRQRQLPTRGGCCLRSLRQLTKIRRRIVTTQPDRHRRPPFFIGMGPYAARQKREFAIESFLKQVGITVQDDDFRS